MVSKVLISVIKKFSNHSSMDEAENEADTTALYPMVMANNESEQI